MAAALCGAAGGLYYLWVLAAVASYNGVLDGARLVTHLLGIGYWMWPLATAGIFLMLTFGRHSRGTESEAPKGNVSEVPDQKNESISRETQKTFAYYRPWSERTAWLQITTAIALLTFVAVFRDGLFSPDLFQAEHAEGRTEWFRPVFLWIGSWWKPVYLWTPIGVASMNLAKGIVNSLINTLHSGHRT